jgi:hypothetical protein
MHLKGIVPSGWIYLTPKKYNYTNDKKYISTKTTYSIVVDEKDIKKFDTNKMAPFLVASFDIECVSLENRFP